MKKFYVMCALAALVSSAQADGYVGASVGRGKLPFDCAQEANCKQRVNVFKLYAGTRLKDARQLDLGIGRIDALEVGFMRTNGKATETRMVTQQFVEYYPDPGDPTQTIVNVLDRTVPARRLVSVDALVLAPVLHVNLTRDVDLFVKAGAAIVSATVKTTTTASTETGPDAKPREVSLQSNTRTKLKPYLAFGASYAVASDVKVFGSADWVPYSVDAVSGTARVISLGAEMAF